MRNLHSGASGALAPAERPRWRPAARASAASTATRTCSRRSRGSSTARIPIIEVSIFILMLREYSVVIAGDIRVCMCGFCLREWI